MKIKCPNCGSAGDIALFLGCDDASAAIATALQYCEIGADLMRYLGLFKPLKTGKLSPMRVNKLLNELLPDFRSQKIERNGVLIDAPMDAWRYAINIMLSNQSLSLPLKSHGYLYEIIKGYQHTDIARGVLDTKKQETALDQDGARRLRMEQTL